MIREVLTYPDKRLKLKSSNVVLFDDNLNSLLDDMYETMRAKDGVGLAAIQIGMPLNVLIINPVTEDGEQFKDDLLEIINPKILSSSGSTLFQEGCLSLPGVYEDVKRFERIEVEFFDRYGNKVQKVFEDFLAIAFQHELDHLNGKLFIERLSILKRKKFEKEWKKKSKAQ
jgi:peptide deformylase